jgi:HlyD family secretion protein
MKTLFTLIFGCAIGASAVWMTIHPTTHAAVDGPAPAHTDSRIVAAAQGRVEGRTEKIEVESSTDGVIDRLLVSEGQKIARDQVVATLACNDLESTRLALEAALESAKQARIRVLRGSRDEERRVADQDVRSAQAVFEQAQRQSRRMTELFDKEVGTLVAAEDARRDLATADAALQASLARQKLAYAGPLTEEARKADADVLSAEHNLHVSEDRLGKCSVRSPIVGTVTRVHLRAGEAVSTVIPRPIVTVVDLSERKVRAEVDERDLDRVHMGQRVQMSAEGFSRRFAGTIDWASSQMGRKTARGTDPAEKSDRDILEVLIVPDRDVPPLPVGLRVTVEFVQD